MSEKLPKVLSISLSTWRNDSNSHTQTDLFKLYGQPDRVAQIYTKSTLPDTPVCNEFFQISENAVMKSVINRKGVGKEVENGSSADETTQKATEQEQQIYAVGHKKKSWLLTLMRELVWTFGKWKTKELDEFVEKVNADVYFVPIYPVVYMGKIQKYILKKYPKPYVCYLADDNYSYENCHSPLSYIHRFWLRKYVKYLAENCTEMFTITKTEAIDTDTRFGTHSIVLTKGIDYTNLEYKPIEPKTPIKMVYTGNLLIGRDSSLVAISKALAKINADGEKITLDIYSPTELKADTMALLNSNGCTHHGNVPKSEVAEIQSEADVVVFCESLEKKHRYAAKLSFSTKLTDYFKSGKCIFAIGDKSIAPIQYLQENDAAIISTEYSQIEDNLCKMIENPSTLDTYGRSSFECGRKNHNEALIKERFVSAFINASNK